MIYPFTVITGTVKIGSGCRVGPLAHLRDGTVLDDGVEVGAFVEIKESHLGSGTLVRHLAYLGDAEVGEAGQYRGDGRSRPISTASGRARRRSATAPRSAPARSWWRLSPSATTPSSGPTRSSRAGMTSPTARPSSACRRGRSSGNLGDFRHGTRHNRHDRPGHRGNRGRAPA